MKFLITGDRSGGPVEIEADNFRLAVAKFCEDSGQRAISLSWWCENPQHVHWGGQWESADELLRQVNQQPMTAAELGEYMDVAMKFRKSPYSSQSMAIREGREPVTLAMVQSESRRRSAVMRKCLAPGSPAGPELMSQVVTAAMDGFRAVYAWRHGVRPYGYAS